jgi:hypothetical protein
MDPETIRELATPLLNALGIGDDPLISPMPGSSLKRTFKLHHEGLDYALKWYPITPPHLADPFDTERHFYQYLKEAEVHENPFALSWEISHRIGVFSLLHGRAIRSDEVNLPRTLTAGTFLAAINEHRHLPEAGSLPGTPPREQSMSNLLDAINGFMLQGVPEELRDVQPLVSFWEDELVPGWQGIIGHFLSTCETSGIDPSHELEDQHAILSPGEFTFHNTIITPEHKVCFCDFDQARWGDPACVIARFFTQPDFNVKMEYLDPFLDEMDGIPGKDPVLGVRLRLLMPIIRIERSLTALFPHLDWDMSQLGADTGKEGKVMLIQNLWQARQQLKAGLHLISESQ